MPQTETQSDQQAPGQRWLYPPGWVDRLTRAIEKLPGPSWVYYLLAWLALFSIETLIKWRDRAYPVGTIFPFHVVFTALGVYAVALMDYLDRVASRAMRNYRSVFKGGEREFDDLHYQLTHVPFRSALLASLTGVGLAAVLAAGGLSSARELKLLTSPLSQFVDGLLFLFQWWAWGALIYHTIRQLRLVSVIYTRFTLLDLFNQGPLYAFSRLAARTALGLVLLNFAVDATGPGALSRPGSLGLTFLLVVMALVTFFWPLRGVHRLLEAEKGKDLEETTRRFLATITKLHQRVDTDQLSGMDEIENTLSSLEQEEKKIAAIPTWPWQPDQIRLLVSTILLPIVVWIVQQVFVRVIGR